MKIIQNQTANRLSVVIALAALSLLYLGLMAQPATAQMSNIATFFANLRPLIADSVSSFFASAEEKEDFDTITLKIKGMTCGGCAIIVQMTLEEFPGVIEANVSFQREKAIIKVKKDAVQPKQLIGVVNMLGYRAFLWEGEETPRAVRFSSKLKVTTWGALKQ